MLHVFFRDSHGWLPDSGGGDRRASVWVAIGFLIFAGSFGVGITAMVHGNYWAAFFSVFGCVIGGLLAISALAADSPQLG
jgi:hypothetical protein